jgi:peptidoglycan hydrolase-like protein with peptidoglycan-binding domain
MFDLRKDWLYAALLFGFTLFLGFSGPALAQSGAGEYPAGSGVRIAQASNTVLEIQRALNQLGYNAGPIDGSMGARTRGAIQSYQRDHNLLVDGQATSTLLSHVRATARSSKVAPDAPTPDPSSSLPIADIQEALRSLGYEVGRPSGRLTDETRAAIRSYESDHGLLMSGEPSAELLQHMRQRIGAAPPAVATDANTVARIQAELRLRGYPIPLVSGRMDSQTRQAIREYQQGQGVPVTGEPSLALLDELRAASAESTPDVGLSREQRAAAQRTLNARGYDAGPPDGVLGPRSRSAIQKFHADHNLSPTDQLTSRTLELLGISAVVPESPKAKVQPYRVRVRDDFADGDYTRNPTWRIASGRFEVRNGGLTSALSPPSERAQDIGRQMLGDLLKQQTGFTLPGQESAAAAYLPTRIAQQFRITMVVSGSAEAHSHIDLGPYRGDGLNSGYRLNYRTNQSRPLQLLFVDESGMSAIASARFRIDSSGSHRLIWQRDAEGRMTVTRNGEVLIDVVDQNLEGDFGGFSLINAGGDWTLHEVIIEDRS